MEREEGWAGEEGVRKGGGRAGEGEGEEGGGKAARKSGEEMGREGTARRPRPSWCLFPCFLPCLSPGGELLRTISTREEGGRESSPLLLR